MYIIVNLLQLKHNRHFLLLPESELTTSDSCPMSHNKKRERSIQNGYSSHLSLLFFFSCSLF